MTKEKFKKLYVYKYIKCHTQEELNHIITTYARNEPSWKDILKNSDLVRYNTYNKIGLVITFNPDLYAYWGYKDDEIDEFIDYEDIFEKKRQKTQNE